YAAFLLEGNDISGIDVGFLVNKKLKVKSVSQLGLHTRQVASNAFLFDRPPLLLELDRPECGPEKLSFVVVHNRSFRGLNQPEKRQRVRKKRMEQAEWLGGWVNARLQLHPNEALVLLGDFNALPGGVELLRMQRKASGGASPSLLDLGLKVPLKERYSFRFRGKKQAIDHMFVTKNLVSFVQNVYYTRFNTEGYQSVALGERVSDHEGLVAQFDFEGCKAEGAGP
ncbi:MAG: hypothetical protein JKY01_00730, partial [Pseudomonadales bacterium]|nr:hypothetical protein [Pseudomonadales bacterium]